MSDYAAARAKMVDSQLRTEDVTDYRILAAMAEVARERFVPERMRPLAYIDEDILLRGGTAPRYLMEPAPLARLLQLAEISDTDSILDVGCGTGYAAAVLARLAGSVVALDHDADLAAEAGRNMGELEIGNVRVVVGPLEGGYPDGAPYDVIVMEGAVEFVPDSLFAQLSNGGRLVAVVGYGRAAPATVFTKTDGDIGGRVAFNAHIRPLPGFTKPKGFVF
jgi:protein-L-isoaspartate(D-aspartate) O-methyltransferase